MVLQSPYGCISCYAVAHGSSLRQARKKKSVCRDCALVVKGRGGACVCDPLPPHPSPILPVLLPYTVLHIFLPPLSAAKSQSALPPSLSTLDSSSTAYYHSSSSQKVPSLISLQFLTPLPFLDFFSEESLRIQSTLAPLTFDAKLNPFPLLRAC